MKREVASDSSAGDPLEAVAPPAHPGALGGPKGTYRRFNIYMGRDVGMVRSAFSSAAPFVTTKWITLVVEENNCASKWNRNEVVTIFPDVKTGGVP